MVVAQAARFGKTLTRLCSIYRRVLPIRLYRAARESLACTTWTPSPRPMFESVTAAHDPGATRTDLSVTRPLATQIPEQQK